MKVEELEFVSDMVSQQVLAVAEELFSEIADLRSLFSGHQMSLTEMALEHTDPKTGKITYRRGQKLPQGANPKNWRVIANQSQGGGGGGGDAAPAAKQPRASKGAAAGGGAAPDASGGGKKAKGGGGGAGGGKQPAGGAAAGQEQGPAPGTPESNVPAPEDKQQLDAEAQAMKAQGLITQNIKTPEGFGVAGFNPQGQVVAGAIKPFNFEPMEEGMEPLPSAEGQEQGAEPAAGDTPAAQTPPAATGGSSLQQQSAIDSKSPKAALAPDDAGTASVEAAAQQGAATPSAAQPEFDSSHIAHPGMKKVYEDFVNRMNESGGSSKLVSKAPNGTLTFVGLGKDGKRNGNSVELADHHLSPEGKKIQPQKTTPPASPPPAQPGAATPAPTQGAAQPPVKPATAPTGGRNAKLDKTPPPPRSASASIATAAKVQQDQGTTSPQATPGTQVPTPQTPGKAVRPGGGVSPEFDPNQPAERRNLEFNKVLAKEAKAKQDQGTTSAAKGSFDVDLETGQKISSEDKPAQAATPPSPAPAPAPPAQSSTPQTPPATPPQQQAESQEPDQPQMNYLTGQPTKPAATPQSQTDEVEADVFNANFNKYMKQGMPTDKAMQAAGKDALKAKQQAQQAPTPPQPAAQAPAAPQTPPPAQPATPPAGAATAATQTAPATPQPVQPAAQAQPAPISGQTAPNQGANKAQTAPAHQPQTPPPAAPQAAQPQQPADNSGNAPLPAQPVSIKNWEGTKAPKSKPVKLPDHVGAEATKQVQDIVDHFNNNPSLGKTARIVNDAKGTHLEVFDTNTGKVDPKLDILIHGHGAGLTDFSGKKYTPDPAMSKPVGPSATAGDISDNDVQSLHGRLKAGERVNKGAPHEVAASLAYSRGYTEPGHVKEAMAIADRISKEAKSQSQFENQLRSEIDARFPKIEKDKQVVWPGKPHGVQLSDHLQNTAVENLRRLGYNDPKTLSAFKSSVAKFMKANPGVGIGQATASLNKYMEKAFPRKEQIADVLPGKQEDIAVPTAKNVAAPADQTGVPTAQAVGLPQAKMAPAGAKAQDQAIRDRQPGAAQPAGQTQATQPAPTAQPSSVSPVNKPGDRRQADRRDGTQEVKVTGHDNDAGPLKMDGEIAKRLGHTPRMFAPGVLDGKQAAQAGVEAIANDIKNNPNADGLMVGLDVGNQKGLNNAFGANTKADEHGLVPMAKMMESELKKIAPNAQITVVKSGGDEFSFLVHNQNGDIDRKAVSEALNRVHDQFREHLQKNHGLDPDTENPRSPHIGAGMEKALADPDFVAKHPEAAAEQKRKLEAYHRDKGFGIRAGIADIHPGHTFEQLDQHVGDQHMLAKHEGGVHVHGKYTDETGNLTPHGRETLERIKAEAHGAHPAKPGSVAPAATATGAVQASPAATKPSEPDAGLMTTGTPGAPNAREPLRPATTTAPPATTVDNGPSDRAKELAEFFAPSDTSDEINSVTGKSGRKSMPKSMPKPPAKPRPGQEMLFHRAWTDKLAEVAHRRGYTSHEDMDKALTAADSVLRTGKTGKELMHAMNEKLARDFPIKEEQKKAAVNAAKKNQNVFKSTLVPLSKDPARMPAAFKKFIHKNTAGNYVVRHTGGHTEFSNVQDMVKWVNQKHAESHARENKANKRANKPLIDLNRSEHWLDNKAAREMSLSQDWQLEIDTLGALAAPFLMSLKSEKYDFGCALFKLPSHIAEAVKAYGDCIPKEYLAGKGREEKPHITLLYGLHDENAVRLASVVNGWGPVKVRLGQITLFQCPEYDVLKFEVDGSDLRALNNHVRGLMEHTSSWEVYRPHVTIAYLKHGCGYDYTGLSKLTGQEFELPLLTYCSPDGQESLIPLGNISPEMLAVMATMDSYLSMSLGGEEEAEVVKPMSRRLSGFDTPVEMAVAHAPAGGSWVAGEFFKGGEFIPKWVMDKATDEEKDKLHGPTQEPLSERDKLIRHLTEKTIKALEGDANSLLGEQAQQYLEASKAVFAEMSTPQLRRTAHNLTTVRFFPSPKALTQELNNIMGPDRTRKVVGGAWLQDEGAGTGDLLLDGDLSGVENVAISDIYAHEYGHVFDGDKSGKLTSESSAWKAAWKQEIAGGQLDKYAKTDSYEGFAEYARLYLTKPDVAQKKFPQCWTVWQESGLVE